MNNFSFSKNASEGTIKRTLKRAGYNQKQINSFLRGWKQLNNFGDNNGKS